MVRREAASVRRGHPWPPLRSAGMLLTFLAMALVTTLSGNLGIQATPRTCPRACRRGPVGVR
ncbi:MAG: hypothetical protein IPJ14_03000 [Kineosporiaceae bacterium]|nr:hypothetical protein [Kineosporiaceae bacterium]